jgi:hypothetical protein
MMNPDEKAYLAGSVHYRGLGRYVQMIIRSDLIGVLKPGRAMAWLGSRIGNVYQGNKVEG